MARTMREKRAPKLQFTRHEFNTRQKISLRASSCYIAAFRRVLTRNFHIQLPP